MSSRPCSTTRTTYLSHLGTQLDRGTDGALVVDDPASGYACG